MTVVTAVDHAAPEPAPPAREPEGPAALGPGAPLPAGVHGRVARAVGGDPGPVRVHTGPAAAALAAREGARAVTEAGHIAFAAGRYRPGTLAGEALLAHEVAHARQQDGAVAGGLGTEQLEHEADRAGVAAALTILTPGPDLPGGATPVPVSRGRALGLQRCVSEDTYFTDPIKALPSREEYEQRGELMPKGWDAIVAIGSGSSPVLELPGVTSAARAGEEVSTALREVGIGLPTIPEETGKDLAPLDSEALLARLAAMELRDDEISALAAHDQPNIPRLGILPMLNGPGSGHIAEARHVVAPGEVPQPWVLVDLNAPAPTAPKPEDQVPQTLPELTREVARSEQVQLVVRRGLTDVVAMAAEEERAAAGLPGYDPWEANADIYDTKLAYVNAATAVLTPAAVAKANHAVELHAGLRRRVARLRLRHFQNRSADQKGIGEVVSRMNTWAWALDERLTRLETQATELAAAEKSGAADVGQRRGLLAREADLVMTSIEALGEWDMAVQAYDLLAGNSSLVGFGGVDDVVHRMDQMNAAFMDDDLEYLQLLLRDHRADPAVRKFYESIPAMIQWSQFVLALAITFLAIVIAAPIGIVAGGLAGSAAVALGAAKGGTIVLAATFIAHTGVEALVFTLVSRGLSSGLPGMAPTSPAWKDFLWNWGLFAVMRGLGSAITKGLAQSSRLAVTAAQLGASALVLQSYGMLRFAVEHDRAMTGDEVLTMAIQNVIMLGVLSVATMPFGRSFARLEQRMNLMQLRTSYGRRFADLDGQIRQLEKTTAERLELNPDASEKDLADLNDTSKELDRQLQTLVDEVVADPAIDVTGLRTETAALFSDAARLSLVDLLRQAGLPDTVMIRPTGSEAAWTVNPGRAGELVEFLGGQGITTTVREVGGRTVVEAEIPGRGTVTFTQGRRIVVRPGEPVKPAEKAPEKAPEKKPSAPKPPPKPRGRAARTEEQNALVDRINKLRSRVYAWRGREAGTTGVEAATRVWLDQLTEQAELARQGGAEHDVESVLSEIEQSLQTNIRSYRPRTVDSVVELEGRLMRHAERARTTADRLVQRAAAEKDAALKEKLLETAGKYRRHASEYTELAASAGRVQQRMRTEPGYDARSTVESIIRDSRKVGAESYDVYLPLQDPVTFAKIFEWLARETLPLLERPGGEFLRREILDQLSTASELVMRQSPRQAGLDVNTTARMRRIVMDGIAEGRYSADFVDAWVKAGGRRAWPRTPNGDAWQIDHVFELWHGGGDELHNYLPLDPRLHEMKTEILGRFRAEFRDANKVEGEQVEVYLEPL